MIVMGVSCNCCHNQVAIVGCFSPRLDALYPDFPVSLTHLLGWRVAGNSMFVLVGCFVDAGFSLLQLLHDVQLTAFLLTSKLTPVAISPLWRLVSHCCLPLFLLSYLGGASELDIIQILLKGSLHQH